MLDKLLSEFYPKFGEPVSSLLDFAGDGIRIVDTDFRIIFENQAHRKILGSHAGEYCYYAYQRRDDICENCVVEMSFKDGKTHKQIRSAVSETGLKYLEVTSSNLLDANGRIIAGVEIVRDVTERKQIEAEKEKLISELQDALNSIRVLKGLIPICAWCRKVRDDKGYWKRVEKYIEEHSDASFTHSICPGCLQKTDPEAFEEYQKTILMKKEAQKNT
jgi:transcriptional regulator with PAS, ATPase and Fis domain